MRNELNVVGRVTKSNEGTKKKGGGSNAANLRNLSPFHTWTWHKFKSSADARVMNSWSVLSLSSAAPLQSDGSERSPERSSSLVPSNNAFSGAGERGPGTNVAIMLMVGITGGARH